MYILLFLVKTITHVTIDDSIVSVFTLSTTYVVLCVLFTSDRQCVQSLMTKVVLWRWHTTCNILLISMGIDAITWRPNKVVSSYVNLKVIYVINKLNAIINIGEFQIIIILTLIRSIPLCYGLYAIERSSNPNCNVAISKAIYILGMHKYIYGY